MRRVSLMVLHHRGSKVVWFFLWGGMSGWKTGRRKWDEEKGGADGVFLGAEGGGGWASCSFACSLYSHPHSLTPNPSTAVLSWVGRITESCPPPGRWSPGTSHPAGWCPPGSHPPFAWQGWSCWSRSQWHSLQTSVNCRSGGVILDRGQVNFQLILQWLEWMPTFEWFTPRVLLFHLERI